jgi:hypothetical protein
MLEQVERRLHDLERDAGRLKEHAALLKREIERRENERAKR